MRDSQGRFIRNSAVENYQEELLYRLNMLLELEIKKEWASMQEERALQIYSPRIDVAVGPFATEESLELTYNEILERWPVQQFIRVLVEFNRQNLHQYGDFVVPREYDQISHLNFNARCLLAIEIENKVSRKHLMGGAINASALGRLGIVIPWSEDKLHAFIKLVRYLHYLRNAQKNTFDTSNLLIVTRNQMDTAINETLRIENRVI